MSFFSRDSLFIIDLDTKQLREITGFNGLLKQNIQDADLHPYNNKLAVASINWHTPSVTTFDLTTGSMEVVVQLEDIIRSVKWSNDGKFIAYATQSPSK